MKHQEASIEVTRKDGKLFTVSAVMPAWNKVGEDGAISVTMPFFGLKTFAIDENDEQVAIEEAIRCFCDAAEKHGKGLDEELIALGWTLTNDIEEQNEHISFDFAVDTDNFVLEQVLQTGEQFVHSDLEMA